MVRQSETPKNIKCINMTTLFPPPPHQPLIGNGSVIDHSSFLMATPDDAQQQGTKPLVDRAELRAYARAVLKDRNAITQNMRMQRVVTSMFGALLAVSPIPSRAEELFESLLESLAEDDTSRLYNADADVATNDNDAAAAADDPDPYADMPPLEEVPEVNSAPLENSDM